MTQPLTVKMDPRVKTLAPAMAQQFNLSIEAYEGMQKTAVAVEEIKKLRNQIKATIERAGRGPLAESLSALDKKLAGIGGEGRGEAGSPGLPGGTIDVREANFTRLNNGFSSLLEHLQSADLPPTTPMVEAGAELQRVLTRLQTSWSELRSNDLSTINTQLREANLPELK
jgi:hypothetical protein